jgi:hypothetical protein
VNREGKKMTKKILIVDEEVEKIDYACGVLEE